MISTTVIASASEAIKCKDKDYPLVCRVALRLLAMTTKEDI